MGCSQGGKGAGFRAGSEDDTYDKEGKRMFHVRGTSDMNAKAIQVSGILFSIPQATVLLVSTKDRLLSVPLDKGNEGLRDEIG